MLGTRQPGAWAGSSKTRFARIWTVVHSQLDDTKDLVHWIPAHTTHDSIGQRLCSDERTVSKTRWYSNQIVDLLANEAAHNIRVSSSLRNSLKAFEGKLFELAIFLGRLTAQANRYQLPDGTFIRVSEAFKRRSRSERPKKKVIKASEVVCAPSKEGATLFNPADWLEAWRKSHRPPVQSRPSISRVARIKRAGDLISQRQEAAFQEWWRESRSHTMQPRPESAMTAEQRMAALRNRVAARTAREVS